MKLLAIALAAIVPALAAAPPVDKGKVLGSPTAPITIEIFGDFACPSCRTLHENTLPQLVKDFASTGKAYIVSREFPLGGDGQHKFSREAAIYATAAARIGKYFQVSDRLFAKQEAWWFAGKVWGHVAAVLTPEEQKKVLALSKDKSVIDAVQADWAYGQQSGISETPTVFVTRGIVRTPLSRGVLRYDLLKSFLDDLLKR
jgi:protein-disulfide isomerase